MTYFSIHSLFYTFNIPPPPLKCFHTDNLPQNEGQTMSLCDVSLVGGGPEPPTTDESPPQWFFILQYPITAILVCTTSDGIT